MTIYNEITITEENGTNYVERVGWGFEEASKILLGKEGKNGSAINSVRMKGLSVTIQGVSFPLTCEAVHGKK